MHTEWSTNLVHLTGRVVEAPTYSHTGHGEDYYCFPLESVRLSGAADRLNILITGQQQAALAIYPQQRLTLTGHIRSYNNRSGVGHRLVITVLAQTVEPDLVGVDENRVTLVGALCRRGVYRRTPLGREITDLMLAVNRPYGRADYIPCIAWGSLAQRCALLEVGAPVVLEGRLQSRRYTKQTETGTVEMTAYEVSAMTMELEQVL